jgi:hypothetical protein
MMMVPADRGPLIWAPVRLNVDNIKFSTSSLGAEVRMHGTLKATTRVSLTRNKRDGSWIRTVNEDRFRLLEAECQHCQARGIAREHLCDSLPVWIAHVEKHEVKPGFGSHHFWHGLRAAAQWP